MRLYFLVGVSPEVASLGVANDDLLDSTIGTQCIYCK